MITSEVHYRATKTHLERFEQAAANLAAEERQAPKFANSSSTRSTHRPRTSVRRSWTTSSCAAGRCRRSLPPRFPSWPPWSRPVLLAAGPNGSWPRRSEWPSSRSNGTKPMGTARPAWPGCATSPTRGPASRSNSEPSSSCPPCTAHLLPRFAATPIAAIDYPCVLASVAGLQRQGLGAGTVRNIRDVLRLVLGLAVRSGALKVNPVTDVEASRTSRSEMIFLDPDQIMTLAERGDRPAGAVPARGAPTRRVPGVRAPGALRRVHRSACWRTRRAARSRLDLIRRRVEVNESGSEAYGELQLVPTKTYKRERSPSPASLDRRARRAPRRRRS